MRRGMLEGADVWIVPHATEHCSQWPWCWDFPVCCRPVFQLAGCRSCSVLH